MADAPAPRIVMPVYEGVDLLDVCGPAEMFHWAGYTVDLLAESTGPVTCNNGFVLQVPRGLGTAAQADALWIPGGDPDQLDRIIHGAPSPYLDFVTAQAEVSTWVCSVCQGALLAAAAGLFDGYAVTTHWAFIPYLMQNYPDVTVADGHPRFTLDRDRLTGGGISSGLDEALRLIELLSGTEAAQSVQKTTQYYPDPPVASAIPNTITSPMPAWPPTK